MATKIIHLDDISSFGEPTVQLIEPRGTVGIKLASEALDYIKNVRPEPGKTIILVLAMTAGEHYGPNRNGDAWPENPLSVGKSVITAEEVLPKHFKTFETDARLYRHHVNKDPAKSIGRVLKAFYNWAAHRVELLLAVDNEKAEDIVQRVHAQDPVAVSMGCFTAGNKITMFDLTRKNIEDVVAGDLVLTHEGRARRVKSTHVRKYTGDLHSIKPAANPEIHCTAEHPFLVVDENCVKSGPPSNRRWTGEQTASPTWVHASCLADHMLLSPVLQDTVSSEPVPAEFARLLGAYLADGHVTRDRHKNPNGIELNVYHENPIVDGIDAICRALGLNSPVISAHPVSELAIKINVYGAAIAEKVLALVSGRSTTKRLAPAVLLWDVDSLRQMFGSYANGDGCGTKSGALQLSTGSEDLAWQLVAVAHRLGILPSVQRIRHRAGNGFNNAETVEFVMFVGKQWAQKLHDICYKVKPTDVRATRMDRTIVGANVITPIRSISVAPVVDVDVYNLEVEDDESYVVNGVSVHNCRVPYDICSECGNQAPTRVQYCTHAKSHLMEIGPRGNRYFVWNPRPKFFDISIVRRPADRLGWMMRKVANEGVISSAELGDEYEDIQAKAAALRKMSLINKVIQGEIPMARDGDGLHVNKSFIDDVATKAAQNMPPIPDDTIQKVLGANPATLFSTLASMGIILTTPEFIKYFVWKMDPSVKIPTGFLRRAVAMQSLAFEFLAENPELVNDIEQCGLFDSAEPDPDLATFLRPLMEKRSQFGEYLYRHALPDVFKSPHRRGLMDTLTVNDPHSGRQYQTTRSAAHAGQDWAVKSRTKDLVGGGLLLGAGYKLLRSRRLKPLGALLALPGAAFGYRGAAGYPSTRATSGESVALPRMRMPWESRWNLSGRGGTEMVEKRSSFSAEDACVVLALDNAHTQVKYASVHLPNNVENVDFDAAARWFGDLICR